MKRCTDGTKLLHDRREGRRTFVQNRNGVLDLAMNSEIPKVRGELPVYFLLSPDPPCLPPPLTVLYIARALPCTAEAENAPWPLALSIV